MSDARLDELRFLARLERERRIEFAGEDPKTVPDVGIAIHLLASGTVNNATTTPPFNRQEFRDGDTRHDGPTPYAARIEFERWKAIGLLHERQQVYIFATHASAVRRADLEQSIQRGRLKDPMGIVFDGRHAVRDLQVALFSASKAEPVTVAFLDMNGLKRFNEDHDHDAGDDAIRALLEVIADAIVEVGEAHRVGGDEVVVTLPKTTLVDGANVIRTILRGLSGRKVRDVRLSAVAGITTSTDPGEPAKAVRTRADKIQKLAKEFSKSRAPDRFGALAIDGQDAIERIEIEETTAVRSDAI